MVFNLILQYKKSFSKAKQDGDDPL